MLVDAVEGDRWLTDAMLAGMSCSLAEDDVGRLLYFMVALFGLVMGGKEGWALSLQALPVLALLLVVLWMTIWRLIDVFDRQVVVAPWWMQDRHNSRLLEHRQPPRFPIRTIKAVRYTGTCPVC